MSVKIKSLSHQEKVSKEQMDKIGLSEKEIVNCFYNVAEIISSDLFATGYSSLLEREMVCEYLHTHGDRKVCLWYESLSIKYREQLLDSLGIDRTWSR